MFAESFVVRAIVEHVQDCCYFPERSRGTERFDTDFCVRDLAWKVFGDIAFDMPGFGGQMVRARPKFKFHLVCQISVPAGKGDASWIIEDECLVVLFTYREIYIDAG